MVDIGDKDVTQRVARARGRLLMLATTLAEIREGRSPKGDVVAVARVAGIQAAKRTAELVPLCHPLPLSRIEIEIEPVEDPPAIEVQATVATTARTGVEMEALTAVSVALLTLYDMAKAIERGMTISDIALVQKRGGAGGPWERT